MTDESELNELRARIARLSASELIHLFELALGDHRRIAAEKRAEIQARTLAGIQELLEMERQTSDRAEVKRAAG